MNELRKPNHDACTTSLRTLPENAKQPDHHRYSPKFHSNHPTFTCPELRGHDNAILSSGKFNTIPALDDVAPSFAPAYGHVVPTAASTSASFPPKSMKTTDPPHQESQEVAMNRHTTAPGSRYPLCIAGTVYFRRTRAITLSAGSRNYRGT